MLASTQVYPGGPQGLVVIFDLQDPEAATAPKYHRAAWHEYAGVELLDGYYHALIIRPGGAKGLLRKLCEGKND